jgi:hypothetical protein
MEINGYNLSMAPIKAKLKQEVHQSSGKKKWPKIRCSLCGQLDILPQFVKLSPGKGNRGAEVKLPLCLIN